MRYEATHENSLIITFPWSEKYKCFHPDVYSPEDTDQRLSQEKVKFFLSKIDSVTNRYFFREKMIQFLCALIFIGGFIELTILLVRYSKLKVDIRDFLAIGIICYILIIPIYYLLKCMSMIKPSAEVDCQNFIDDENERIGRRGLRWLLPKNFPESIELHKDYLDPRYAHKYIQREKPSQKPLKSAPKRKTGPSVKKPESVRLEIRPENRPQQKNDKKYSKKNYEPFVEEDDA